MDMVVRRSLGDRIRPLPFVVVSLVVIAGAYVEVATGGPPTPYAIALWLVVVPLLFAATVDGVRSHPLYEPLFSAGLVAIGVLQYFDGAWQLLAALFVLAGVAGLAVELRRRRSGPAPSRAS